MQQIGCPFREKARLKRRCVFILQPPCSAHIRRQATRPRTELQNRETSVKKERMAFNHETADRYICRTLIGMIGSLRHKTCAIDHELCTIRRDSFNSAFLCVSLCFLYRTPYDSNDACSDSPSPCLSRQFRLQSIHPSCSCPSRSSPCCSCPTLTSPVHLLKAKTGRISKLRMSLLTSPLTSPLPASSISLHKAL